MKKFLLAAAVAAMSTSAMAKYEPYNFNQFTLSIYKGHNSPDAFGAPGRDNYLEIEGSHRYELLDLYWFVDRNDIFGDPKSSAHNLNETIFAKVNPRISIDGLLNKDLSIGPVDEWFLAYMYKATNGSPYRLDAHYFGLGTNLNVPGFDFFGLNLYAKYNNKNFGDYEKEWDGYTTAISYGTTLYDFQNGFNITLGGWGDFDFGLRKSQKGENAKSTALQWANTISLNYHNVGISYTYQINDNFTGRNQNSSDKNNHAFGVHYTISL